MYKIRIEALFGLMIILCLTINAIIPIIADHKSSINSRIESTEIRTSSSYEYEWLATYGKDKVDRGFGITMDSLKNIYITGFQDGGGPLCLLKYNNSGFLLWNRTWGHGFGQDIVLKNDNSIYLTGFSSDRMCLLEYNSSGNLLLNKTWGYLDFGIGYGIDLDSIGNIYITGHFCNYGGDNSRMALFKYNTSGHLEWNKTIGVVQSEGKDIVVDEIGNIYITGYKETTTNKEDLCILKYNSSGNLEWEGMWGGPESDCGNGITLDNFGNIYITGYKKISLGDLDLCLLKYNSSGNLEWAITWGGDESESGNDIKLDNLGNIYITGFTGSFKEHSNFNDILLAKFDKKGNILGFKTWGAWSGTDYGYGLIIDDLGYAYITGAMIIHYPFDNFVDIFLLKYDLDKIPIIFNPAIPGYNIYFLIIGIGIVFVITSLIKRHKLNFR